MTHILKNPELPDYFEVVSYQECKDHHSGLADKYESGKVLLLKGAKLDIDYSFLNTISFGKLTNDLQGRDVSRLKKMPVETIISIDPEREQSDLQKAVFDKVFFQDVELLRYFQSQIQSGHEQIMHLFHELFPIYECFQTNGTWRFTPTLFENLHWDNFPNMDDRHQVRIFHNIDSNPRIWHVSYPIEQFCEQHYHRFSLETMKNGNPNAIIEYMDRNVLGGMTNRCLDGLPRHAVAFEQGDIWLADSRLISHQVYQGSRAAIYMFHVNPESMSDPNKRFNKRIEKLHSRMASFCPKVS